MPDWESLKILWEQIFGNQVTAWLLRILGSLATIWLTLWLIAQIVELWKNTIWPIFYNSEEKRKNFRRRLFAEHLENEIKIINRQERDWEDYRFAELEAEVEAEGLHSTASIIPLVRKYYTGLKREKSLSKALKNSKEPTILLEGEPGSGKSVALRHLALDLIQKAKKSRNNQTVIPIYINLRGLKRLEDQHIDRQLIYDFIKSTLKSTKYSRYRFIFGRRI